MGGETAESIGGCVETMWTDCPKTASLKAKEGALDTLRKDWEVDMSKEWVCGP